MRPIQDAAVSTGQRSEALLFAANGLISKCVTGVGTFFSGLILAWVSFPQHATPGQVDPEILRHLGMGRPEQMAAILAWCVSPENGLMTGQILSVDGGYECLARGENSW
jgi:Na+/melibiose symporter-like transporter